MQTRHCLYCGQEFKLSFDEPQRPPWLGEFSRLFKYTYESEECDRPMLQYTCSKCGLTLTQTDLDNDKIHRSEQESYRDLANASALSTEEETLEEVKGLLHKCLSLDFYDYLQQSFEALEQQAVTQYAVCSQALGLLFRHGYPLQHPLEFALCRDLCRVAPLLLCHKFCHNERHGRYQQLDVMLSNALHLSYFLSQSDSEQLCQTLTRLSDIFLLLGDLPMCCHTEPPKEHDPGYTDLTCRKRAAIIGALALQLEEFKDSPQGTEYLKMAQRLWHKVLEQGQEISLSVMLGIGGDAMSQLPSNLRLQVNAEIQRLNVMIAQRDPHFRPGKLPLQPFLYAMPMHQKVIIAAVVLALFAGCLFFTFLHPSAAIKLQKTLGKLSFLVTFGIDGGEVIAMFLYPVLFVFGGMYLEPRLLSLIYKMFSPR